MSLFGQGLVRTPSNFGQVGDRPALPELLEFLAAGFVEQKVFGEADDPRNRAFRCVPAVFGEQFGERKDRRGQSLSVAAKSAAIAKLNRCGMRCSPFRANSTARFGGESKPSTLISCAVALYAKTSRFQQDETLSLFDLPAASVTCEQRVVTNVPLQKLFFLNSDVVAQRSAAVAKRIET